MGYLDKWLNKKRVAQTQQVLQTENMLFAPAAPNAMTMIGDVYPEEYRKEWHVSAPSPIRLGQNYVEMSRQAVAASKVANTQSRGYGIRLRAPRINEANYNNGSDE